MTGQATTVLDANRCSSGPVRRVLFRAEAYLDATLNTIVRLASFFLILSVSAHAQTWRGAISGVVLDPSDARVSNATITVTAEETGKSRSTVSNDEGDWSVGGLAPGDYRVEIQREGFATSSEV